MIESITIYPTKRVPSQFGGDWQTIRRIRAAYPKASVCVDHLFAIIGGSGSKNKYFDTEVTSTLAGNRGASEVRRARRKVIGMVASAIQREGRIP